MIFWTQTRRVTRATSTIPTLNNGKENATARTTRTAVLRAKQLASADIKPAVNTRVTASTAATRAKTVSKPDSAAQGKRKREALGVVSKPGDNRAENRVQNVDAGPGPNNNNINNNNGNSNLKGKARVQELKEKFEGGALKKANTTSGAHANGTTTATATRQPLRTVSGTAAASATVTAAVSDIAITRRTRSTSASTQAHHQFRQSAVPSHSHLAQLPEEEDEVVEEQPQPHVQSHRVRPLQQKQQQQQRLRQQATTVGRADDVMMVDPAPVARVPSPRRFVAAREAVASGLPLPSSRHDARRRLSAKQVVPVEEDEDEDDGPAYKKRRTSSDVPDVEEEREVEVEEYARSGEVARREADPDGDEWDDLDADDGDDPLMVSEYVVEIFKYLKEVEVRFLQLLALLPFFLPFLPSG